MRLTNKITVQYVAWDDFGNEVVDQERTLKCIILEQKRNHKKLNLNENEKIELSFITNKRNYQPYSDMLKNESLRFVSDGVQYEARTVSVIRDFGGKVKHYRVDMKEV